MKFLDSRRTARGELPSHLVIKPGTSLSCSGCQKHDRAQSVIRCESRPPRAAEHKGLDLSSKHSKFLSRRWQKAEGMHRERRRCAFLQLLTARSQRLPQHCPVLRVTPCPGWQLLVQEEAAGSTLTSPCLSSWVCVPAPVELLWRRGIWRKQFSLPAHPGCVGQARFRQWALKRLITRWQNAREH